jgi:aldehyde dehydrogenase (NAD+)
VVLKPAQLTPWSGSEYGRIVAEETDIPAGVFNVVVSNANDVGAALSADASVDMITFTGSTATGRAILAAGAATVKKTLLELGGKSAHIVLDDADFDSALPLAAMMACVMSGQSCILPSRILLPRSRYDEGIELLKTSMENFPVGDPWTPANMQGPQISEAQRQKVLGLVESGIDSGARLVTGGGIPENVAKGYYVQPTLLADVDPDSQISQEEIFGPELTSRRRTPTTTPSRSPTTRSTDCPARCPPAMSTGPWPSPGGCAPATSPSTASPTSASPARSAAPSRAGSVAATATKATGNTWRARQSGYPGERSV